MSCGWESGLLQERKVEVTSLLTSLCAPSHPRAEVQMPHPSTFVWFPNVILLSSLSLLWSNPAFYIDVQFTKSHRVRKNLWGESQLLFLTASQWSLRRRESERYHLLMWSGMMQLWCPIMWKLNCCSVSERSSCQIPYEANMGLELSSILSSSHHKFEGWPLMFYLHPVPSNVLCCFMYIKLGCKSILGACTAHSVEACIEYSAKQLWTSR